VSWGFAAGVHVLNPLNTRDTYVEKAMAKRDPPRLLEFSMRERSNIRDSLGLDVAHQLARDDQDEARANRALRLLQEGKAPCSCEANIGGKTEKRTKPTIEPNFESPEISFQVYRNYLMVVQGSLAGTESRNFIIDSGADPSVIDSRVAQELHLKGAVGKLALLNQVVDVQQAVLPSVEIGPLRVISLPVFIRDLAFLQKSLGIRVDAVIGLDMLSLSSFTINFASRKILFGPVEPADSAVPFQSGPPLITVQMKVQGVILRLLLDTGASGLLLFQSQIRDRLPHLTSLGERTSSNMGGDFRLKRVRLLGTYLGLADFGQQIAFVVEDQQNSSRDFEGLLGISALGFKQIAFDFEHCTFSWKR
jgi:hypothetical protein